MLFLIFIAISIPSSTSSCPLFQCNTNPPDTCISYNESANTNTVQRCQSGYICPYNMSLPSQTLTCVTDPSQKNYPGESCKSNSGCSSNNCTNSYCVGVSKGNPCNHTLDCAPGLYCSTTRSSQYPICITQLSIGNSGCIHSSDCSNLAYCNQTNLPETSFCIGSMTLLPGTVVSQCYNGINYLCQYLYCITTADGSVCADEVMTLKSLPVLCATNRDCMSTSDRYVGGFYLGTCTCGSNPQGNSYCTLFPGDGPYSAYIEMLSIWVNSPNITLCNSDRGTSPGCINTYFGSYSAVLLYYMYYTNLFPLLQRNSGCVKDTITYSFWYYEEIIANMTFDSSAKSLAAAGVLTLLSL